MYSTNLFTAEAEKIIAAHAAAGWGEEAPQRAGTERAAGRLAVGHKLSPGRAVKAADTAVKTTCVVTYTTNHYWPSGHTSTSEIRIQNWP